MGLYSTASGEPILRWAGSKRKLIPRLLPFWEVSQKRRYIEPFVGSAALFFAATPNRSLLSDTNSELICTYETVRSHPARVARTLSRLPRTRRMYNRLRQAPADHFGNIERAARFIFLNRHCFNGLYRTNNSGKFNVPFAPARAGAVPDEAQIKGAATCLRRSELRCGDFEMIVSHAVRPGDFVYLDPPYAVENRRIFRQYSENTFGFDDLQRLVGLMWAIDAFGASFVLSYALCPESRAAFAPWFQQRVFTQRNIAGFVSSRRRAVELIVTNLPLISPRTG